MKTNPFEKHLGKEDHLHHQVIQYLRLQYPNVIFFHAPNEGKRTPFEQFKLAYLGGNNVKTPDLAIMQVNKHFHGLFLELKSKSPFKLNGDILKDKHLSAQAHLLDNLKAKGYDCYFCWRLDDARQIIDNYMKTI
jgi:hypothetical protein